MTISDFFSADYAEARDKFVEAARAAGAGVARYDNPEKGPRGEDLSTDIALVGPEDARFLFLTTSGTHGVEGFCGSGCQVGYLRLGLGEALPPDTAMLLVHAINPHGFAHLRRVNEDNVDLNRNYRDFAQPLPANKAYDEVHPWLMPADWNGPARKEAERAIAEYIRERGQMAFQASVSTGQYGHDDGLFYGGRAPVWSRRTFQQILRQFAAGREHVAYIDFHTGLGPRGYGEPILVERAGSPMHRRATQWYGPEVTCPSDGNSTSANVQGTMELAFQGILPDGKLTALALEYGTQPVMDVLTALRADHWLHSVGGEDSALRSTIKQQIRNAFYQDAADWKVMVFARALDFARRAFAGLAAL